MSQAAYAPPQSIRSVAVLGTGSVCASWTALFLAQGIEVVAYDPGKDAEAKARTFVGNAWPALRALRLASDGTPPLAKMRFVGSAGDAAQATDVVQENLPEHPEVKAATLRAISAVTSASTIILSSTGGVPPSSLQLSCVHPERFVSCTPSIRLI